MVPQTVPPGMQDAQPTAWLEGARIDSRKTIKEESIATQSVLTLLWIDKRVASGFGTVARQNLTIAIRQCG